jgi:hypothetical protein
MNLRTNLLTKAFAPFLCFEKRTVRLLFRQNKNKNCRLCIKKPFDGGLLSERPCRIYKNNLSAKNIDKC